MKILWLDINASYSHSSLAIPAMDAQLEPKIREMHQWQILSGSLKLGASWFVQRINNMSPDLVLSTLWLFNHTMVMEVLAKAHALNPELRIILGGPEFLGDNNFFLASNPFVESVFRGEGEEMFPQFVKSLGNNRDYLKLQGFCSLDSKGNYIDNGYSKVNSFNSLAYPEKSFFFNWEKPFVQLETSRGCFNKCAFCISGNSRNIDELPVKSLKPRINLMYEKGIREIRILDRTFNANIKRTLELIQLFNEFKGEVEFHTEIHPSFINAKFMEAIETTRHGTMHFEAGIQSLRENVLLKCNRYDKKQETLEGITYLSNLGKHEVHTDLIAGLPDYSFNELIEDLNVLVGIFPGEIQLESLKLLPGTSLKENAPKYGIKYSPIPPYEVLETPSISFNELELCRHLSAILDIYYNKPEWKHLFGGLVKRNNSFIELFAKYFLTNNIGKSIAREKKGLVIWEFCKNEFPHELDIVAVKWMENGLSFNIGPGLLSKVWKIGDKLTNPLYNNNSKESSYRYLEFKERRHWFLYNRKSNSSKSLLNYIEIF
ncbi:MAG: DUF4080 domain-containing protein [Bacteroidales bacterium]|nr:DUF4080 domain-containing protein [Bacteroidales bacterium]MDD4618229.1 DUF4080 domain-containing protein [Bacteroidales bacterium]